jgi:threonine dehydratase
MSEIIRDLENEILMARSRVYSISDATPLQKIDWEGIQLYVKREDLGPINAYKWRGAYNRMAELSEEELKRGVVTASAGNHAQGVALAASRLGTTAKIYMPQSTPKMKQDAVRKFGGDQVEILLVGDTFDEASHAAHDFAEEGYTFIHPYDHLLTIAGQGTIADEIVMSGEGEFDVVFLQIGGGGLAAGVACWLRKYYPQIRIIGVEGVHQAGMSAAFKAGKPVTLDYVDVFCDGTAVKRVGDTTYRLCKELLDEIITVDNRQVCSAIQFLWEKLRCIPEPAGALGIAAFLKKKEELKGKKVISIVCGANMDFGQLGVLSRGLVGRQYYRLQIDERSGTLSQLLSSYFKDLSIMEFQYGKSDSHFAWPVIGVDGSPSDISHLESKFCENEMVFENVTGSEDVEFGIIPYDRKLITNPYFIKLEFHERKGALLDFLKDMLKISASICFFKYTYTGERVGRALVGFDFESDSDRKEFKEMLTHRSAGYRSYSEIDEKVYSRLL